MKISKRQLKRIIKEEKRKVLNEQPGTAISRPGDEITMAGDWYDAINNLIYSELAASGSDLKVDGRAIIEALENLRRDLKDELRGPTR